MRTNNESEYSANALRRFCTEIQINQEFIKPKTLQQKDAAERYNRLIAEMTPCPLAEAKLPSDVRIHSPYIKVEKIHVLS